MEIIIRKEAREDLTELDKEIRENILEEIGKLEKNATPKESTFIQIEGLKLFRLKLQTKDRNSRLNHRIFYQIKDDKVYIRGIFHRQNAYSKQTAKTLRDRI